MGIGAEVRRTAWVLSLALINLHRWPQLGALTRTGAPCVALARYMCLCVCFYVCLGLVACAPMPRVADNTQDQRSALRLALATGYFEQAQYAVALEEVNLALAASPHNVDALNLRGLTLMRLQQAEAARESFAQALRLQPRHPDTLHNLGAWHCEQGHYALADRDFELALASGTPRAARTWTARGLCQVLANQPAAALRSLLQAQALQPGQPLVTYNLGWILYRQGEFDRAQSYTRSLNNSPQANAESLWLGVRIERALGQTQTMNQLADQLKKRYPLSRELHAYERGAFDE